MNKLTQALMEELTVEYVKVGSLQIPESVVISWVIMLLLVVGSILLTRNLKVDHISKRQAALEALYSLGKNFFEGLLGKEGSRYVPYLMTVALYIACSYKGYAQVDYNGVVMSVSDGIKEADAPVLSGVVTGNIFFGDTIKEKNVLEILGFLSKLDKEVTDSISEIAVDGSNNVKFNLRYGYPILLGNADNISDKLDIFITVFNDIKTKNIRAEYIDLTFAKPYIKLRQKA